MKKNSKLESFQLSWISTFLEFKLELDLDYEKEVESEGDHEVEEDLFSVNEISDLDLVRIFTTLQKMEDKISETESLGDYLDSCERDTALELYLSTSGHGAGFFDHGTDEGDRIQKILDDHFTYVTEDWHFSTCEGILYFN